MPKYLANLVQRRTAAKHLGRQAVAEKMGPFSHGFDASLLQRVSGDNSDYGRIGELHVGGNQADEHIAAGTPRPVILQITRNGLAHVDRQWQPRPALAFVRTNSDLRVSPVNVLQLQRDNFSRAKTKPGEKQQDGIIAPADGGRQVAPLSTRSTASAGRCFGNVAFRQFATIGTTGDRSVAVYPR